MAACGDCRFWHRIEDDLGECRAHPPLIVHNFGGLTLWAKTTADGWCGEYSAGQPPKREIRS
jgi:hypothetical protein